MKVLNWMGNTRSILSSFPDGVRKDLGTGLMYLQCGAIPHDAKPFKTGMPRVWELRAKDASGQYRVIYVCMVAETIHVLHCFKKTSRKTAKIDVDAAQARYHLLKRGL
ncbi:MAG: type II toxin-antitoxin system RelE/ParE family toxin [Pseudomonadota bacterium]